MTHLVCICDGSVPIEPVLAQLNKQNIAYELLEQNSQIELRVQDPSLVEPVRQFYQQYLDQYQNRLSIQNLKRTPITTCILLITFIVALITQLGQQFIEGFLIAKIQYYPRTWFYYEGIENTWRIISPIFLHFNIEHLIFNTLSFWYLGSILERNMGRIWYLGLVISVAAMSNVSQLYSDGPLFGGLSGVVYGFIGFAFFYQKLIKPLNVPKGLLVIAVIWMLLGMFDVLAVIGLGNMANAAHFTGMVSGIVLLFIYKLFCGKRNSYES